MEITYLGHSAFKLKGKDGVVVTDPYHHYVGFSMPVTSADIVTISHDHQDHNDLKNIKNTARRRTPFVINQAGEYEVGGVSVFGSPSFHDANGGLERGENNIFVILIDGIRVCHLGDLGHELSPENIKEIGDIDILLVPVGGVYTIDPKLASKTIKALEPSIAIPMHFKSNKHDPKVFGDLATLDDFLKEYGAEVTPETKLVVSKDRLPEETEIVVLTS